MGMWYYGIIFGTYITGDIRRSNIGYVVARYTCEETFES